MIAHGLTPLVGDLLGKAQAIDDEAEETLDEAAEKGVRLAKDRVRRRTDATAESISADSYETAQGPGVTWGPTTKQGFYLEVGTATMGPFPYLGPSLGPSADHVTEELGGRAADL